MTEESSAGTTPAKRCSISANQLAMQREEVRFWQEMLASQNNRDLPYESLERMRQALALAQYRLAASERQRGH